MGKDEFYSRKGADKTDSYVLLGTDQQLVAGQDEAAKKGWEDLKKKSFNDGNGESTKHDQFSVINLDNIVKSVDGRSEVKNGLTNDKHWEEYTNVTDKLSTVIKHETGHPKFRNFPAADSKGHIPNTIMDENIRNGSERYSHRDYMIIRLRQMHGTASNKK